MCTRILLTLGLIRDGTDLMHRISMGLIPWKKKLVDWISENKKDEFDPTLLKWKRL